MEEDIELIILVNSERVIGEKLLKEALQNFVKIGKDDKRCRQKQTIIKKCRNFILFPKNSKRLQ